MSSTPIGDGYRFSEKTMLKRKRMMRASAVIAIALMLGTAAASAQQWHVLHEQEVSVGYGKTATETELSVTCSGRQSEIYVHVAPGTKPPAQAPTLVVKEGGATNTIALEVYVCGRPTACSHRPDGEVATYFARVKGKALALRFAEKMTSAEVDAPGAKVSVAADRAAFRKFAAACRKWK